MPVLVTKTFAPYASNALNHVDSSPESVCPCIAAYVHMGDEMRLVHDRYYRHLQDEFGVCGTMEVFGLKSSRMN